MNELIIAIALWCGAEPNMSLGSHWRQVQDCREYIWKCADKRRKISKKHNIKLDYEECFR